jgi:hypothetical protein
VSDALAAQGRRRYLIALAVLFGLEWIALAIRARYRADWALENALVVVAVGALMLSARRVLLSRLSYTLIFVFLSLHEVGAHYTYSEVPYEERRGPGGVPTVSACAGRRAAPSSTPPEKALRTGEARPLFALPDADPRGPAGPGRVLTVSGCDRAPLGDLTGGESLTRPVRRRCPALSLRARRKPRS